MVLKKVKISDEHLLAAICISTSNKADTHNLKHPIRSVTRQYNDFANNPAD
jgi:hypothetical protein